MNREQLEQAVDTWDPAEGDLPDEVALALDADEGLRARFDARFGRWTPPAPEAAPDLARVLPRRGFPWRGLALAAAALLVVSAASTTMLAGRSAPAPEAVLLAPSEPFAAPPPPAAAPMDAEMASQLMALGYLSGDAYEVVQHEGQRPDGFRHPGVNGFVDPRQDPLSTFAVDVDRGSYTFARRRLREGFLPDPAGVRTEEFVNALSYTYPHPEDGPFTVVFDAAPTPFSDRVWVRIGVQARRVVERRPVHLTFLVDTSGSMQGPDRLPLVKRSLGLLVDQLRDGDTVAIATYAGSAGVALRPTPASDRARILNALQALESGGSTAMGEGIALAYRLAEDTLRPGHMNRVVIASDGDANVGVTDPGALTELVRRYADRGVALTTLGFGEGNYQDFRMEQLANDGDGNYYYVDGIEEARRVFVDELTATMEVVARDVKIQVEWNPAAVRTYRQVGYENRAIADADFRNDRVDAGEVGAGHAVTALYEVELQPGASSPIATVRLRSKPPGADADATERRYDLPRAAVHARWTDAQPDFRRAAAMAAFAERLRGASAVPYGVITREVQDSEVLELVRRAAALSGE